MLANGSRTGSVTRRNRKRRRFRQWLRRPRMFRRVNNQGVFKKMKYVQNINLTPGNGQYGTNYFFRGNSVYDPDVPNPGRQPPGFDQMALIYNKYRVLWSKADITVVNTSSNGATPFHMIATLRPQVYSTANYLRGSDAATRPNVVDVTLTPSGHGDYVGHRFKYRMSAKKLVDRSVNVKSDEWSALTSADPTNMWYWVIGYHTYDDSLTLAATYYGYATVRITYYVHFFGHQPTPDA